MTGITSTCPTGSGLQRSGYHLHQVSNRSGRSWINRDQQGGRSWIPSPVQVLVQYQVYFRHHLHPSQTRDSNPNPPIGDFDCGGDLDISSPTVVGTHLTRHCLLQTPAWVTIRIPHPPQVKLETHLHLMGRHCLPGSGPGPGPVPTKVHPISNHPPPLTTHPTLRWRIVVTSSLQGGNLYPASSLQGRLFPSK